MMAQANLEELKAALILQFAKNVVWPQEKKLKKFTVGFYGNDTSTYQVMKNSRKLNIKGVPLVVKTLSSLDDLDDIQLLYVDEYFSYDLTRIANKIDRKNILLVTDHSPDTKNVMLNILYIKKEETISYEINKTTIQIAGLNVQPELLMLRGTEIDVWEIYKQMKEDLAIEKSAVQIQKNLLNNQKREMGIQEKRIARQRARAEKLLSDFDDLRLSIEEREAELKIVEDAIKVQHYSMEKQRSKLDRQAAQLAESDVKLAKQQRLIETRSKNLDSLELESKRQQSIIDDQDLSLSDQHTEIGTQRRLIYLFIAFLVICLVLIVVSLTAYRGKRVSAEKLIHSNDELNKQHNHNLKLNRDLKGLNDMLEERVKERTHVLEEKTKQLTEYSFVNSHLTRAPLSRILGLSNIMMHDEESFKDKELVLAMESSAKELDKIVRRIDSLLKVEGSFDREKIERLIKNEIIISQRELNKES